MNKWLPRQRFAKLYSRLYTSILSLFMGKLIKSLVPKLRRLSFRYQTLSGLSRHLDKSKMINVDQLCLHAPANSLFTQNQNKAERAMSSLFDKIPLDNENFDIPKIIWIYWDKGLDSAPEVVKSGYQSWKSMNPDYEIRFLNETNVQDYFDFNSLFFKLSMDIGIAHKSDFIRIYLLSRFGGVWVDSTTFCWKPLSQWLDTETKDCGIFLFKQAPDRKDRQIKNWFIASSKGNPVTVSMLKALTEYNFRPRPHTLSICKFEEFRHLSTLSREGTGIETLNTIESWGGYPYFYFHYLFNDVVKTGIEKSIWNIAKRKINNHTNADGEIGDAYVSKQNYNPKYMASHKYQERIDALLKQIHPDNHTF